MNDKLNDINRLLNETLRFENSTLKILFEKKISELKLPPTSVLEILDIDYRSLKNILEGNKKLVDVTKLIRLANFIQIPQEKVFSLYLEEVEKNFPTNSVAPEVIKFIKDNFDLAILKKAGIISSLNDFGQIEKSIKERLGLKSIFEYRKPSMNIAFSSGLFKPQNEATRSFWIEAAKALFEELNNPYEYDRQTLITYFPTIRWHSQNVEQGLVEVIKSLFKIGITVIYQPALQTLQLRGATFSVADKPCIVLTNYLGFYPTLWFALIHELYHVLFDWNDIKRDRYHLTDDDETQLSVREREDEADNFAREYLFSKKKSESVKHFINDEIYVAEVARDNQVHSSIIYIFAAFDAGKSNGAAWARARKFSPDVQLAVNAIDIPWQDNKPVEEVVKAKKANLYN